MVSFPTISAVPVSTLRHAMLPWIVTRVAFMASINASLTLSCMYAMSLKR